MICILLVEDDIHFNRIVCSYLTDSGYTVVGCYSALEAIEQLEKMSFDIIISDIMMPAIDGYQLCRMIKNTEETRKIPVILLTMLDKKIDSFWGKKAGAQLFLLKSIDIDELTSNINATVRRYPVSEEYKKALKEKDGTENPAQTRLNTILNDLLLKSMFSNEFRNLSDFLNYERICYNC